MRIFRVFVSYVYFCVFVSYVLFLCSLCLYKRKVVVSLCYTLGNLLYSMEFCNLEDTNDSWVFDVDETQVVDRDDDDTMIWDAYHTEGSTDSWIWEVDESQYGGGDDSTVTENGAGVMDESRYSGNSNSTVTENGAEEANESRYGSDNAVMENGTEEMDESQYDDDSVVENDTVERFYTISDGSKILTCIPQPTELPTRKRNVPCFYTKQAPEFVKYFISSIIIEERTMTTIWQSRN